MAYNSEPGRAEYTASAGQTLFPFSFKVFNDIDVKVYLTPSGQSADDASDILTLTTDYAVVPDGDIGGDMTLVSPASIGDKITIIRELALDRLIEYQTSGDLLAATLNQDQEYQTYLVADQSDKNTRHISLAESAQGVSNVLPAPSALKVLGWNPDANALANFSISDDSVFVNILNIDSIALLSSVNTSVYSTVNIKGYYTANDGGGGIFNYDATQSAVNNGGTVINGWVRQDIEPINVKWFGAKGDSINDDTSAIQSAINYAETISVRLNGGASVYIPQGEYSVTSTLTIKDSQIVLYGDGVSSQLTVDGDYGDVIHVSSTTPLTTTLITGEVRDLFIYSNTTYATVGACVRLTNCSRIHVSNITTQGGYYCLDIEGCDTIFVNNCDLNTGQKHSVLVPGTANMIVRGLIDAGAVVRQASSIYLDHCQLRADTASKFIDHSLYVASCDGFYINGCHFGLANVNITTEPELATSSIQNLFISSSYIDGDVEGVLYNMRIMEAKVTPHTGVYQRISVGECIFSRAGNTELRIESTTVTHCMFTGCHFTGGTNNGIAVTGAASNFTFTACSFGLNNNDASGDAYDVYFVGGNTADNFKFIGCNFDSTGVTKNIRISGGDNFFFDSCTFSKPNFDGAIGSISIKSVNCAGLTSTLNENYGTAAITSDANGEFLITHNLYTTPNYAEMNLRGDSVNQVEIVAVGATTLTGRLHNASGADVPSSSGWNVIWTAKV